MLSQCRSVVAAAFASLLLFVGGGAGAATIDILTTPFTGTDAAVRITLTEQGDDILVTATVEQGIGDLRGIFLDFVDDSVLEGLSVTGDDVTGFDTGNVIDVGQGANVHGGGTPCPCDLGVEIGTPGIGKDDFLSTSFVISHETLGLTLGYFSEQSVAVRMTSVGPDEFSRGGSSKLSGQFPENTIPIPEPTTALLFALGLGSLGFARGRRAD